ncbi:MAG: type II toxin-antitoxin system VapC family toxin [Candidatus Njordarchaeales archaeon]
MGEIMIDTDILIMILEKASLKTLEGLLEKYELYISGIVAFEFLVGVYRTNKKILKELLEKYFTIVPITYEIIVKAAEIEADLMRSGQMIDPRDALIGATAIIHEIPLWTNNVKDFKRLEKYGLKLVKIELEE